MVQIISWNDTKELILSDYRRIKGSGGLITFVRKLFLDPSFSVTFWLRLGNYFFMRKSLFSHLSLIIIKINLLINQRLTGIQIPIGTQVKGGIKVLSLQLYYCHTKCYNRKKLFNSPRCFYR